LTLNNIDTEKLLVLATGLGKVFLLCFAYTQLQQRRARARVRFWGIARECGSILGALKEHHAPQTAPITAQQIGLAALEGIDPLNV